MIYRILKTKSAQAFIIVSLLFFSCETHVEEDNTITIEEPSCDPNISFLTSIKPIIDANCVRCHGGSQPPNLKTYEGIRSNANSLKTQVVSRRMPLGSSLTNEEIEQISCWVENGALNN